MTRPQPLPIDSLTAFLAMAGLSDSGVIIGMYAAAIEKTLITVTDALTVRDLLHVAGGDAAGSGGAVASVQAHAGNPGLHALLIAMFACRNQGSMCLPLQCEALTHEFAAFCGADTDALVARAMALVDEPAPLLSGDGGPWPLVISGGRLYFQRNFTHESSLKHRIDRLLETAETASDVGKPDPATAAAIVARVATFVSRGREYSLNDRQKLAVLLALRRRFLVVSGGPGTGKTQILSSLVRAFMESGVCIDEILLTAPTGRAARRMGESVSAAISGGTQGTGASGADGIRGLSGHTIHSCLKFNPGKMSFSYSRHNRLPHRLVVCDEVSMVDVSLMDALLSAVRDDATVVFLGDRDQLPSVDSGAVLGDLVPAVRTPVFSDATIDAAIAAGIDVGGLPRGAGRMVDTIVILDQSYRATGDVLKRAGDVNSGMVDALSDIYSRDYSIASEADAWGRPGAMCHGILPPANVFAGLPVLLESWGRWLYARACPDEGSRRGFKSMIGGIGSTVIDREPSPAQIEWLEKVSSVLDRGRILCALREGVTGAAGINRTLRQLAGATDDIFPGCPVMVTRNSPSRNLFNGDTGIAVATPDGLFAWFRGAGGFVSVPVQGDVDLVPAFAVTVHKSQGSEYGNVLVVLPDDPDHPLMTREILYTAMTRASNNVWFLAHPECLRRAIGRKTSRYSGIDLWS